MMTTWHITDKRLQIICLAYCDAKPFWWGWFFGWRGAYADCSMDFKLTPKVYETLVRYAEIIKD